MDIKCPKCGEPWEMDSLHDEVERRYPNKPWHVDTKPEVYHVPDQESGWCNVLIAEGKHCNENKDKHPIDGHEYVPLMLKSYKTYNYNSFLDHKVGKWFDEKIYDELYQPIRAEFQHTGCATFHVPHNDTKAHPGISALYDVLGDDLDGAAVMMEDFDL